MYRSLWEDTFAPEQAAIIVQSHTKVAEDVVNTDAFALHTLVVHIIAHFVESDI